MIVNDVEIRQIVSDLEVKYNSDITTNLQHAILDSKLAIIEFCGWIEQTFDEILVDYCANKLIKSDYLIFHQQKIIEPNYGFHYEKNFRGMILKTIGINNLESIEDCLENYSAFLSTFKSILGTFTVSRNKAAHTYTPRGALPSYDTPSIVLNNTNLITPILQKIEQEIMKY